MILIEKESADLFEEFKCYENCHFCKKQTDTWHKESNNPVCVPCSEIHNEDELIPNAQKTNNVRI